MASFLVVALPEIDLRWAGGKVVAKGKGKDTGAAGKKRAAVVSKRNAGAVNGAENVKGAAEKGNGQGKGNNKC